MRTNPRQHAPLTRCNVIERTYSDPSLCQTIAKIRIASMAYAVLRPIRFLQNLMLKATPSRSFSSSQVSAASVVAKTLRGPFLSPDFCHHHFVFSIRWENRRGDRYSEVVQPH